MNNTALVYILFFYGFVILISFLGVVLEKIARVFPKSKFNNWWRTNI